MPTITVNRVTLFINGVELGSATLNMPPPESLTDIIEINSLDCSYTAVLPLKRYRALNRFLKRQQGINNTLALKAEGRAFMEEFGLAYVFPLYARVRKAQEKKRLALKRR